MNLNYFNLIAQLLAFEKMEKLGLKNSEIVPFSIDNDFFDKEGVYYNFIKRVFFGDVSEDFAEKAISEGVIEKTEQLYWIDPESEDISPIYTEKDVDTDIIHYFSDGFEIYPQKEELLHTYKISSKILEEAKLIYKSIEQQLSGTNNTFTFVKGGVQYRVPIVAVKLIVILNESKNISKDLADINKHITFQKIKDTINLTDSVYPFLYASTSWEKLEVADWKDTVVI